MSRRNWSVRFAIVGALAALTLTALGAGAFFGASHTPNYGYQTEETANRRTKSEEDNPTQIDRDRAGLPYLAERVASGPDPSDGQEREKRDLAAQESMSVWAFWLLMVSALGTITTMIGTGFLLWQIMLTREAVQDTGDATKAMNRQNELAAAAQRAWLVPEPAITSAVIEDDGIDLEWECLLRNRGSTVAREAKFITRLSKLIPPDFEKIPELIEDQRNQFEDSTTNIIPNESIWRGGGSYQHIPSIEWSDDNPAIAIILIALARYKIEGDTDWHITERVFMITIKDRWFTILETDLDNFRTENVIAKPFGSYSITT